MLKQYAIAFRRARPSRKRVQRGVIVPGGGLNIRHALAEAHTQGFLIQKCDGYFALF